MGSMRYVSQVVCIRCLKALYLHAPAGFQHAGGLVLAPSFAWTLVNGCLDTLSPTPRNANRANTCPLQALKLELAAALAAWDEERQKGELALKESQHEFQLGSSHCGSWRNLHIANRCFLF